LVSTSSTRRAPPVSIVEQVEPGAGATAKPVMKPALLAVEPATGASSKADANPSKSKAEVKTVVVTPKTAAPVTDFLGGFMPWRRAAGTFRVNDSSSARIERATLPKTNLSLSVVYVPVLLLLLLLIEIDYVAGAYD